MILRRRRLLSLSMRITTDKNTDNSANQAADYGEDYSSLEAGGGTPVSPSKKGADGGEYANSFG
ncbi:MAG: hypothetical protein USCAAHI_02600 [Beijerinckiaceae bacterium]|nr:MAG: hypothetical protein USCAAHI_02600 [Beijerinckiaceae bacterium]